MDQNKIMPTEIESGGVVQDEKPDIPSISETTMEEETNRRDHLQRSPTHTREEHLGSSRQYWRDMILGVNDGLVSTFLLVAGVGGGGMPSRDILLTGIAGALAGAVSMSKLLLVRNDDDDDDLMDALAAPPVA